MKISEIINRTKKLYPSPFDTDTEQLVLWCNEVTALIKNKIMPEYLACGQTFTGKIALPDGVEFSDVVKVYANGKLLDLTDERTNEPSNLILGDRVRVVYKVKPVLANTDEASENYYEKTETACGFPHELMYIDFLCSQIAFHQNDLADYNKFILSYNQRLKELEEEAVERDGLEPS